MTIKNINKIKVICEKLERVKITTFVVKAEDLPAAGKARAKHLGDARPTSSTIIVSALVVPSLLIEIEAVAAAKA